MPNATDKNKIDEYVVMIMATLAWIEGLCQQKYNEYADWYYHRSCNINFEEIKH